MTIDYSVRDIITAVSEGGLDDVCKRVELNVSKSKTVTVPEYEVTPAVPAVTETRVKTPAVDAEDAIPAVSAVSAVMGERHKHVVTQEEVTTTETVTVKEGNKWVQKEVSTTETKDIHTAQYKEVDLWNAEGKKKIGKHQEPVMESYEASPAISAVAAVDAVPAADEVTEEVEITPAVAAETSTSKTFVANTTEFVDLDDPDPDDFTAYASVTEKIVIDWAKTKLGADALAAIEAKLDANIGSQESPPIPTTGSGVPW